MADKRIRLYDNIDFFPLKDEDGDFGLMIMTDNQGQVVTTATIESQTQFRDVYSRWVAQVQAFNYAGVN